MKYTEEQLNQLQEYLTNGYNYYLKQTGKRKASDNQYARWLGVPPPSLNQWIHGYRAPGFENAILLAEKLGPEIFDILNYPTVVISKDPSVKFLVNNWEKFSEGTKSTIYKLALESVIK